MIKNRKTALKNINEGYAKMHIWAPELKKDYELCLEAAKVDSSALCYAHESVFTEELCLEGMKSGNALSNVPLHLMTQEMCDIAINHSIYNYRAVPEKFQTEEINLRVVRMAGTYVQYIANPSYQVCLAAVQHDGRALQHVPEEHRNGELVREAVSRSGNNLQFVPAKELTEALCFLAVKNGCDLSNIPEKFRSDMMYYTYVENNSPRYGGWNIPKDVMLRAMKALIGNDNRIIPTMEEEAEWRDHIYNTLLYISEDHKEYAPTESDSLSTLLDKFMEWNHHYNGGYRATGEDRFCNYLAQEYKARW